ncbi:unnamed protein product [Effrenium voratum]|uniref:Mei2-like C-terminal RNA recognition motif domain-containing protein n=1 Tax=Effrenium voratum TaxID=2562239 RepID=A0AA36N313_9DINO|nr:unnamed protein product [Effrenium voratum]CAJ1417809.1 unnamed protein product [Effrenium voratum]
MMFGNVEREMFARCEFAKCESIFEREETSTNSCKQHEDSSDGETTTSSARGSTCTSPSSQAQADDGGECVVVVKSTFIDVDDGKRRIKQASRSFTEPAVAVHPIETGPPSYEPGKFSDEQAEAEERERIEQELDTQGRTTVMMRNLPNNYTRDMFLNMLNSNGFEARYDFIYLPFDFGRYANLGYAFVNLVDDKAVRQFWRVFQGFTDWVLPTAKVCAVTWSSPHQGLEAHVERYRNSPVMHKSVPSEYKPLIFKEGNSVEFPSPTRRLKTPCRVMVLG